MKKMKNEQNEKKVRKKSSEKKGNDKKKNKKKTLIYLKYHPWINNVHAFF